MLPLAACGFTPAYAPGGPAEKLQGGIRAADPNDKKGYDLVSRLEERLGRGDGSRLPAQLSDQAPRKSGSAITTSNAITRYDVVGKISYRVTNAAGQEMTKGDVDSFTSYSAAGSTISTITDQEAAYTRLMQILADQIVTRLVATSGTWAK